MALAPGASASADNGDTHIDAPQLQLFVMGLFFIFGGITSLNDVIIPKLKELLRSITRRRCLFSSVSLPLMPSSAFPARGSLRKSDICAAQLPAF